MSKTGFDLKSAQPDIVLHSAGNPRRVEVLAVLDYDEAGRPMYKDAVSKTRQDMAAECDINNIMQRYEKFGGNMADPNKVPMYLDLSMAPADLMEAMNTINEAEYAFSQLPAHVRKEFDNDAMRFVEYATSGDDKALERLREWGLAEPAPVEEPPMRVEVVNPPQEPPKA